MVRIFDGTANKKFYHVNVLGFKFRVATNTRTFSKFGSYLTGRGRVFNFGRQYLCFIPKS